LWVHHTGLSESHGYGTNTREWQFDTVVLLERIEQVDADIAFKLTFTKTRERTPDNRTDFEPAIIRLASDTWTSERATDYTPIVRAIDAANPDVVFSASYPPDAVGMCARPTRSASRLSCSAAGSSACSMPQSSSSSGHSSTASSTTISGSRRRP
jgi:hypothetical protein